MVVPFLSISGFVYALARLKSLGISEGKASGMYIFRYIISISTKWIEIAVAMAILIMTGKAGEMPGWVVWSVCGLILVIAAGFILGLMLVREKMQFPKRWRDSFFPRIGISGSVALGVSVFFSGDSAFLGRSVFDGPSRTVVADYRGIWGSDCGGNNYPDANGDWRV